jgi:2-haloacid dehalogenase
MDVTAVVFDLYGTLLNVASVEAACTSVVADAHAFTGLWRQKQLEYTWLRAVMGRYEDFEAVTAAALDYTITRVGASVSPEARRHLLDAWLAVPPYAEAAPALDRLRPRPLAVLSNGTPRMLEAGLQAAGLRDRFDHVLSVSVVRTYKPAPAVYALAERRLHLPREQLLFVSSNAWDVAGAKAFGLPTVWVNRMGAPREELGVVPDLVVATLTELADQVAPIRP